MMAMAADTHLEAKAQGGVMKSLKRAALGGESFFITTLTAGPGGGWVDLAANLPGDLSVLQLEAGQPWLLSKGAFLGAAPTVTIETPVPGHEDVRRRRGRVPVQAEGQGPLVVSAFGADRPLHPRAAGQTVVVDSGHFVAAQTSVAVPAAPGGAGGLIQSAKSGEGLVFEFAGPGEVLMQSRNPPGLISYLAATGSALEPELPSRQRPTSDLAGGVGPVRVAELALDELAVGLAGERLGEVDALGELEAAHPGAGPLEDLGHQLVARLEARRAARRRP